MSFKSNFVKKCYEKGVAPCNAIMQIGISKATYSQWTDTSIPKPTTVKRIADYFGCSISDLLPEEEPSDNAENVNDIFEELRTDPNKRMLFSAMQGATAQEIKQAALILETLKKTRQQ